VYEVVEKECYVNTFTYCESYDRVSPVDAVVIATDQSGIHNLAEMQVPSSSAAATESPSLVSLPSSRTADVTGRSSADAASPGLQLLLQLLFQLLYCLWW